jgi:hypothetical protein
MSIRKEIKTVRDKTLWDSSMSTEDTALKTEISKEAKKAFRTVLG